MSKKRIIILGAGLAGLSAGLHLKKKGIGAQIFEKEQEPGGLCRSKAVNGFTFDYSGHLLHFKTNYVFNLVRDLLGKDNLAKHNRSAWIYSFDRYTRYPFQANFHGLPAPVVKECLLGYLKAFGKNQPQTNFLDWINNTFGSGIAKHFMVPYNSKFWTIPPEDLTCEWLEGFVPVPSLNQLIGGLVEESRENLGYNAQFWYPVKGGIGAFASALSRVQGYNVHTNCAISGIDIKKKEIKFLSGAKEKYDYLISTIPMPEIFKLAKGFSKREYALSKKLKWNSIFNLNLGLAEKDNSKRHWVYFPENKFCFYRVGFAHNFSGHSVLENRSSLYIEVAYSKEKTVDKNKIAGRIKKDLKKAGLLDSDNSICSQDINDIEYGYPVYDANYAGTRRQIMNCLSENNIIPCGRYGSWQYFTMEDAILDGKRAAENFA